MTTLGKRIAERRKQLQMTQEALAELIDSTQRQVSKYEIGQNNPTGDVIARIADALNTSTDWLLGRTEIADRPLRNSGDLDDLEREIIRAVREKSPEQKQRIIEILKLVG